MSRTSSSSPGSGYTSPSPISSGGSTPPLTITSKPLNSVKPPPKPVNVFTNDGSFLERFRRNAKADEDKKKELEALERKRNFDNRFRNRGKRPAPDSTSSSDSIIDAHPAKKPKPAQAISAYQEQLKLYAEPGLKGTGTGIHSLIR